VCAFITCLSGLHFLTSFTMNSNQTLKDAGALEYWGVGAFNTAHHNCFSDMDPGILEGGWLNYLFQVRCAFSGGDLHSRMPLDPTHVRLKRSYMRVINGIPLGCPLLLPVGNVICMQTLTDDVSHYLNHSSIRSDALTMNSATHC
jgi:hypothetical protein